MSAYAGLARRWLQARGVATSEADRMIDGAEARRRRYPWPLGAGVAAGALAMDRLLPTLLCGRIGRATGLDDDAFDALEERVQHTRSLSIRALFLLLRMPLWEQLFHEPPVAHATHPLEPLLADSTVPDDDEEFDVIVIGSGAGGAPVARALADRGHRVLVIERGGLVYGETTQAALERHYARQGFVVGLGAARSMMPVMYGRNVGGTTPINSGTSLDPRKTFLEQWDRLTGLPFSEGLLTSELARVHETIGIGVPERALLGSSAEIFERGLRALGREGAYVLPRNAPECGGRGRCPFGCPEFHKLSTDVSFLPQAMHAGCRLLTGTRVEGVRETADGVRLHCRSADGRTTALRARKCVIAAGALDTPHLIRANRLGARWRATGDNLKVHPASKVLALMPEAVHGERGIAQGMGYLAPELPRIVFEGIFTPKSTVAPMLACAGRAADRWLDNYERAASFGMMALDRSSGTVRWLGDLPLIRYTLDRQDATDLARGMKLIAEAFLATGAERVLLPLVGMPNEFTSAESLSGFDPGTVRARNILCSGFHPQGTAGMGRVVDGDQRLAGCRHLFVSDASVFPDTPGVNPQVTIMALALRLADALHDELG